MDRCNALRSFAPLRTSLGSTAVTIDSAGNKSGEVRYKAWGETRFTSGSTPTTFRYTGQRQEEQLGLYFYNARWYDPALGRFIQADTIVPGLGNSQAWDRYAYTLNNPLRYVDPSGHRACVDEYCQVVENPISKGLSAGRGVHYEKIRDSKGAYRFMIKVNPANEYNPGFFSNHETWENASIFFTDVAFMLSSTGALVEVSLTVFGFLVGEEFVVAGVVGAPAGYSLGNAFHQVITNPLESAFSSLATFTAFGADYFAGYTNISIENGKLLISIGESTTTAIITQTTGNKIPIGVVDAVIDGYAHLYSHGACPGLHNILEINGTEKNYGYISIFFR